MVSYPLIEKGQRSHKYALLRASGATLLRLGASLWVPPPPPLKEGQWSHKYVIASPVEPMNLLSKGSNESLPILIHHMEKCPGTPSLKRANGAINIHSRGPTEQYLCALEPHYGCLHKVKKVSWCPLIKEGQRSHKYAF